MKLDGQQLEQHRCQDHGFDVMKSAPVLEPAADLATLLEGAKVDFDGPPEGIERTDPLRGKHRGRHVGHQDAPPGAKKSFPARGDSSPLCFGTNAGGGVNVG